MKSWTAFQWSPCSFVMLHLYLKLRTDGNLFLLSIYYICIYIYPYDTYKSTNILKVTPGFEMTSITRREKNLLNCSDVSRSINFINSDGSLCNMKFRSLYFIAGCLLVVVIQNNREWFLMKLSSGSGVAVDLAGSIRRVCIAAGRTALHNGPHCIHTNTGYNIFQGGGADSETSRGHKSITQVLRRKTKILVSIKRLWSRYENWNEASYIYSPRSVCSYTDKKK